MTIEEIETLCRALDGFDSDEAERACGENNEPPCCVKCGGEYRMDTGESPTAQCDACAHQTCDDLARFVLLVLPVVRAAMESTDSILPRHRAELLGDAWRHRIADAVDTMRAALEGK